jgi:YgiT-type zinc finger domain-containing protein
MDQLAEEETMTALFTQCPVCGGDLKMCKVEELIRGGNHTAQLTVDAVICSRCSERFYTPDTIKQMQDIKTKLERNETQELQPIGTSYHVA